MVPQRKSKVLVLERMLGSEPQIPYPRHNLNVRPRWRVRAPKPVAKTQMTKVRFSIKFHDWARFLALVTCT